MKGLVDSNFKTTSVFDATSSGTHLSDQEKDIVEYIAGYLLKKLKDQPISYCLRAAESSIPESSGGG